LILQALITLFNSLFINEVLPTIKSLILLIIEYPESLLQDPNFWIVELMCALFMSISSQILKIQGEVRKL